MYLFVFLLVTFLLNVFASLDQVNYAMGDFMSWYVPGTGVWINHLSNNADWFRANCVEAISNALLQFGPSFQQQSSSSIGSPQVMSAEQEAYLWKVLTEVQDNQGDNFYQTAKYFDDVLWYSLAYTRAYEVALVMEPNSTRAQKFLDTATSINDLVTKDSWIDSKCGGGVYWNRDFKYKNAITNELYLASSARLARLTGSEVYLSRAEMELNWFLNSGMYQPTSRGNGLIIDGLSQDGLCTPSGGYYTYNQGVILGGIYEYQLMQKRANRTLINFATTLTEAGFANMTTTEGILKESSCGDGAVFKGVYVRYLHYFYTQLSTAYLTANRIESYAAFIHTQSESVWNNAREVSTGCFGKSWSGPVLGDRDQPLQTSVIDLFTADSPSIGATASTTLRQRELSGICGEHGMYVNGACACDVRYSGVACEKESTWASAYGGQSITLTSVSASKLLCVNATVSDKPVLQVCLNDDLNAMIPFYVVQAGVGNNQVQLRGNANLYLSVNNDQLVLVTQPDDDSLFDPIVTSNGQTFGVKEWTEFKSATNGLYLAIEGVSPQLVATNQRGDSTRFITSFLQKCA